MTIMSSNVLVLNASYEPISSVSMKHAIKMLVRQVAVIEESFEASLNGGFVLPRVLRLVRYVAMKWKYNREATCSKKSVLVRDKNRCAYCGGHATTVDHIFPRSRGGQITWENSVAACVKCNHRKADRTPDEAGMRLLFEPTVPAIVTIHTLRESGRS